MITFILSLTAIFATSLGPILAANTITLTTWYLRKFDYVAQLTGYFLLGAGVSCFFFVPSGRIWGKRHLFVLGTIILIASSLWAGLSGKDYNSMIGARVIQGVGAAPFETLVNAAVGDLYFVHVRTEIPRRISSLVSYYAECRCTHNYQERGKRMAFTNLAVFGGAFFTPIVVGKITKTMGWWWSFHFVAIFCAVCLPFVFFFCPETAYYRDPRLNTDIAASFNSTPDSEDTKENGTAENGQALANGSRTHPLSWRSLSLFNGRKSDEQFWKLLLRPLPLFLHPVILWGCLIQGTLIGWTVFIGVSMAQFFFGSPYWFGEEETGYTYVSAFIGALLGFAISGALADWSAKKLTKVNGGIYEPEFRILLTIPQLVLGCAGLYGWGITADGIRTREYHYVVPLIFFTLEVAGMVVGAVASSLYIVDAYREFCNLLSVIHRICISGMFSYGLTR